MSSGSSRFSVRRSGAAQGSYGLDVVAAVFLVFPRWALFDAEF